MTLLELLSKAMPAAGQLRGFLVDLEADYPDAKPMLDIWIARLDLAIDPANLASTAQVIVQELGQIGSGKIHPGPPRPSDAI